MREDYQPCRACGSLTDSGVCSAYCADQLEFEKQAQREEDGECTNCGVKLCDSCQQCHDCSDLGDDHQAKP
jgi:hypothetical protein